MSATLPVPVRWELPDDRWEAVPPESLGVHNAAVLAVRRGLAGDYDPTITLSGDWRNDDATLEQVADESLAVLRDQGGTDVELVKRRLIESERAPAVLQTLAATASAEGRTWDLRQAQAVLGLVDVDDARKRVVLIVTLTTTYAQFEEMAPELERFLAGLEIAGVALQPGA